MLSRESLGLDQNFRYCSVEDLAITIDQPKERAHIACDKTSGRRYSIWVEGYCIEVSELERLCHRTVICRQPVKAPFYVSDVYEYIKMPCVRCLEHGRRQTTRL